MTKIALFGTSADPPTAAHQQILRWLSRRFDEVAVWASDNPFKSHQTPLEHRATMLQLLIDDINAHRHNIVLHPELSHPRALITVERAREHWQGAELTLVIGADLVHQLPRWYRIEDLLQQVRVLIVPRPGYPLVEEDLKQVRQLGAQVAIANLMGLKFSSTAYRENRASHGVIPRVEAYIHQERLYECQDEVQRSLVSPTPSGH